MTCTDLLFCRSSNDWASEEVEGPQLIVGTPNAPCASGEATFSGQLAIPGKTFPLLSFGVGGSEVWVVLLRSNPSSALSEGGGRDDCAT